MKIRVAIVGFGFMGQMHAQVYRAIPGVELAAIVDFSPEAGAQIEKLGLGIPVYTTLGALLKAVEIDVVDVCLPTDVHTVAAIEAAQAGKHVFCEKPFALNVKDAEEVIAAVEKNGVSLQVGHCIRFWPEYQELEKFIQSGRGGKLLSLSLKRCASRPMYSRENWLQNGSRSMGAALDLHIHDTDFVLHLLGSPQAVHSVGRWDKDAYSHIFTHYLFKDVAVVAEGGWDFPEKWGFQMAYQAVFERAVLEFDSSVSPSLSITEAGEPKVPFDFEKKQMASDCSAGGNISELGGYYNELAYFCECLRTKKYPEIATGKQALESLRTVLAEIQSAKEGREIAL